jgi:hypothetical protein
MQDPCWLVQLRAITKPHPRIILPYLLQDHAEIGRKWRLGHLLFHDILKLLWDRLVI